MNLPTSSMAREPKPAKLLDRLRVMMGQRNLASFQVEEAVRWVEADRFEGRDRPKEETSCIPPCARGISAEQIVDFLKNIWGVVCACGCSPP